MWKRNEWKERVSRMAPERKERILRYSTTVPQADATWTDRVKDVMAHILETS
jgi:hypothetical protein